MTISRRHILTALCMLCSLFTFSENKDSLFKVVRSATAHDTDKYHAYSSLCWEYMYADADTAFALARRAFLITKRTQNKIHQAKVLNLMGACFQIKQDFSQSLKYYQLSLKIGEELGNLELMLVATGNIGALHLTLGQPLKAKDYLLKSLNIAKETNKTNYLASIYNNLSSIACEQKDYKTAAAHAAQGLQFYQQLQDENGICSSTGNLGRAYEGLGEYAKALEYLQICYQRATRLNNVFEQIHALSDIGKVYYKKKNYREAVKYNLEVKQLAEESEYLMGLRSAYHGLSLAYKELREDKKALDYFEKYVDLGDHIKNEVKEEELNRQMIQFEFDRKAMADSIHNAEQNRYKDALIKAGRAEIEKDKQLQMALSVGLGLVILLGILIFNRFLITNRQKKIIEDKNRQTEEQKLIIEEKQKEIVDSITYAKRIQDSLLDNFDPVQKFFSDAFLLMKPKDIVSGDFYWLSKRMVQKAGEAEELFFIAVCDSTGHGVPGGFMSLLNMAYLSEAINEKHIYQPNRIFDYVRDRLINTISKKDQKDGFDGVLLCFKKLTRFNDQNKEDVSLSLCYAAAHNAPVIVRNGQLLELETDKMPVGYGEVHKSFTLFEPVVQKGDAIYLYTDGYADQFGGPRGKKFKYRPLNELIVNNSTLSMAEQCQRLESAFTMWKGSHEQVDDVLALGIKID